MGRSAAKKNSPGDCFKQGARRRVLHAKRAVGKREVCEADGKLAETNDQSDLAATLRAKYDDVMNDDNNPNKEVLIFNDGDEEYYLCKMCGIDVLDVWWV